MIELEFQYVKGYCLSPQIQAICAAIQSKSQLFEIDWFIIFGHYVFIIIIIMTIIIIIKIMICMANLSAVVSGCGFSSCRTKRIFILRIQIQIQIQIYVRTNSFASGIFFPNEHLLDYCCRCEGMLPSFILPPSGHVVFDDSDSEWWTYNNTIWFICVISYWKRISIRD